MCVCTPGRRIPYCGAIGCEWPDDTKVKPDSFSAPKSIFILTEEFLDNDGGSVTFHDTFTEDIKVANEWKSQSSEQVIRDYHLAKELIRNKS